MTEKKPEHCECGAPLKAKRGSTAQDLYALHDVEPRPNPENSLDYTFAHGDWQGTALVHRVRGISCNQRLARIRVKRDNLFPVEWSDDWAKVVSKVAELRPEFRVEMCLDHKKAKNPGLSYCLWVPPQAVPIMRTHKPFVDTDQQTKDGLPIRKVNMEAVFMIMRGEEMTQDEIDVMFVQAMLELDPD